MRTKPHVLVPFGILLMAALLLLSEYSGSTLRKGIDISAGNFESGDIIFRRGVSPESYTVRAIDGQFAYSHVGIIRRTEGNLEVVHASYGEKGQAKDGVLSEPIEAFLKPASASAAAVLRLNPAPSGLPRSALNEAEALLRNQTPFDDDFDLSTSDKVYCTELVWAAYKRAGIDLVDGRFDNIPLLIGAGKRPYLLPSTLFLSKHLHVIWTSQESEKSK